MHPRLHAQTHPDKPALILASSSETVRYGDLEARANRGAQAFRALGLNTGDTVAMACENRPEFLDIYWAAQRSGLTLIPLSSRLKAAEIAYILQDSEAKALIISPSLGGVAADLAGLCEGVQIVDLTRWSALCASQSAAPIADEANGGRMVYSSGTTGHPKGIRHSTPKGPAVQFNPGAMLFEKLYAIGPNTIYLSPAPLYHSAPMGFTAAIQCVGGTVILLEKFDPEAFLAAIEKYSVTTVMVVPTMFVRLLKLPDDVRARYDLSSLQKVIHAAAPCPIPVKRAMIDWLGPIIHEFYAGSEGNGHVIINSNEWLERPGSVGRAIIGEIHICNDDGGELPVGEVGTVYFGGGKPFDYHNAPEKTAASRNPRNPDWTTMGDVGRIDAEGYLFLSDRKDFMIISGGVNIYPQEVENLLITHPKVTDAAVFGVPNPDFGEEVKAVVQPAAWADAGDALAAELMAWCRERLADVKCPRSVDFERELPRAETGKLYKKELKARYWGGV